ncbi:MAG TPA: site-2 protease family protein [Gemmatimonadaceae bacterium]|nr:site-2 protease family protein [Gemmatimonadaceae bacterium]
MFGKRIHLFTIYGFKIRLDASWFILAVLVTWSLATSFFPVMLPGYAALTYWLLGAGGAVGLFVSIVAHEISHAIVARRNAIAMRGITLFIFGGVAEMDSEPPSAKAEFLMAGAGPVASFALGALLFVIGFLLPLPAPLGALLAYLASINIVLGIFNLVPAFPLDGGRILRAALWHKWKNLRRATRTASSVGNAFGLLLIVAGVYMVVAKGEFIGGMWLALIGMFVRNAATASYQQVLLRRALEGEPVRAFIRSEPVSVPGWLSVQSLVDDVVARHQHKLYPVVDDGVLTGCVSTDDLKTLPREDWRHRTVADIARSCSVENTIHPDADALDALHAMRRGGRSRLIVAENGALIGVLSLKDLLEFFALQSELEGRSSA